MSLITNIKAYWKLDETSGTRYDETANDQDLTDGNTVGYDTGIISNGANFVSTNSERLYISDDGTFDFEYNTSFSTSFWIKTTQSSEAQILSKLDTSSPYSGWEISIGSGGASEQGKIGFVLSSSYGSAYIFLKTVNAYNDGSFKHIVVTYSGNGLASGVTFYVNGSPVSADIIGNNLSTNSTLNNLAFNIGSRQTSNYFNGIIDEVGIWTKELTSDEITSLYNSGSGLTYPFTTGGIATPSGSLGLLGCGM